MIMQPEVLLFATLTIILGCLSYVMWFMPDLYRSWLDHYSRFYRRLDSTSAHWISSNIFYWTMRVAGLLAFIACLAALERLTS